MKKINLIICLVGLWLFGVQVYPQSASTMLLLMDDEGYSTEAQQYISRLTTPTTGDTLDWIAELIDTLALYPAGSPVWTSLDEAWLLANNNTANALQGLKGYKNATAVNSPTLTVWEGIAGNGSTSYINTNFTPSTQGVNYTLDNAGYGVCIRNNTAGDVADIGARTNFTTQLAFLQARNITDINHSVNGIGVGSGNALNTTGSAVGFTIVNRLASDSISVSKNGVLLRTSASTAVARPIYSFYICGLNQANSLVATSVRQYAFAFVGGGLTLAQAKVLTDAVERYLDHLGKGVIP